MSLTKVPRALIASRYTISSFVAASRAEIRCIPRRNFSALPIRAISSDISGRREPAEPGDNGVHDDPSDMFLGQSEARQALGSRHDTETAPKEESHNANATEAEVTSEQGDALSKLEDTGSASVDSSPSSSVPWYLQVDAPVVPEANPFSARQRIPDLPESPPSILSPVLSHVSVQLGMDDLTLLDLRALDPPSALGANLLMIIGTARSEKHLHVSADRLCRWLRSEHNLRPFADGLLGRNEMKLRLKRKAKKSKMLSAVGVKSTGRGDLDDGIRTGWVCVNVGQVEDGNLVVEEDVEDIVGFNTHTGGCRLVVQMMTEEKRGHLDLESLWTGKLRRSLKAAEDMRKDREQGREQGREQESLTSAAEPGHVDELSRLEA